MKDIIELLQKERIKTVDALKNGNKQTDILKMKIKSK